MAETQFVSTSMAAELFQSMGMEITIFAVSIALAATFRGTTFGKQLSRCQQEFASSSRAGRSNSGRTNSPANRKEIAREGIVAEEGEPQVAVARKVDSMVSCANKRQCVEAIAIYKEMRDSNEHMAIKTVAKRSRKGPADVFAALVQCAGNLGRPDLVELLLDDMMAADISRSLTFYETTMKMLAAKKCYKGALAVYSRLEADGLEASSVTLSCLISFAVELGEADRAICFFNRLAACSTPSIRAYMTILRVYSRRQDWVKSLALIRDMQSSGAPMDSLVLNIVLSTGVAAHQLSSTKALLKEFAELKLADVVSYNTVLKGLAQQKDATQALDLLSQMNKTGVKPNVITFNTVIDAAIRGERDVDAWGVLAQMIEEGASPDKYTCTTLMKGLQAGATSEQLTVILDLLKNVPADKNSSILSMLFRNVIEAAGQVKDPKLTARAVSQMREQKVMLSTQEYQRLLKVLV